MNNAIRSRRLFASGSIIAAVLIIGTIGYTLIEGWSLLEGLYMSVITLSTVGYGETRDLSVVGRVFTLGLIVISVTSLAFWTASLTSLFIEGDLSGATKRRRALKMAAQMRDHTIVCGSGMMATTVIDQLIRNGKPVVLVSDVTEEIDGLRSKYPKLIIIEKNPTNELALANASILSASTVVAALDSDFDNLMIAMTCKELGTQINVIARSDTPRVASRMLKSGVDNVVCPYQMTGEFVANIICQPATT